MLIPDLGTVRSTLRELNIDQGVIDQVVATLQKNSGSLDESRFPHLNVPETAFGASATGAQLGYHHLKAHQVIADTLQGVVADLEQFREGVRSAERMIGAADTASGQDLDHKRSAVEMIVDASQITEGDRRNEESRNENLRDGGGATP